MFIFLRDFIGLDINSEIVLFHHSFEFFPEMDLILKNLFSLKNGYFPSFWACNFHIQSIYNTISPVKEKLSFKRECLKLQDGGQVSLDWVEPI
jgi:predicted alpha/beta-fold hydrolase